jgi:hypothetical protein
MPFEGEHETSPGRRRFSRNEVAMGFKRTRVRSAGLPS